MRILVLVTFLLSSIATVQADGWRNGDPLSETELSLMFLNWDSTGWQLLHTSKDENGVIHSVFYDSFNNARSCFLTPTKVTDYDELHEVIEMECFKVKIVRPAKKSN